MYCVCISAVASRPLRWQNVLPGVAKDSCFNISIFSYFFLHVRCSTVLHVKSSWIEKWGGWGVGNTIILLWSRRDFSSWLSHLSNWANSLQCSNRQTQKRWYVHRACLLCPLHVWDQWLLTWRWELTVFPSDYKDRSFCTWPTLSTLKASLQEQLWCQRLKTS